MTLPTIAPAPLLCVRLPAFDAASLTPRLLADRVILVTGAGQGLGRAAALAFAACGATVVLHGRRQDKLDVVYDAIETGHHPTPAIVTLDFLKAAQADFDGMAQTIHATFRRLDGIFHAASHFVRLTPSSSIAADAWRDSFTVNAAAPLALTKACWPLLTRAPRAAAVFLTETHALAPRAYWNALASSKAALTTALAVWNDELPDDSPIRLRLCLPGPVASPLRAQSHPGEAAASLPAPDQLATDFVYLISGAGNADYAAIHACAPS